MKVQLPIAVSCMIVGVALGAAGVDLLHAQGKPPAAYVITEFSDVTDGKTLSMAREKMTTAVANAGGRVLVRTNNVISVEGATPKIFAVISFDSVDRAKGWLSSDAMKESNELRHKASKSRVFIVEGLGK